jgi:Family of unknown function (DUF6049)
VTARSTTAGHRRRHDRPASRVRRVLHLAAAVAIVLVGLGAATAPATAGGATAAAARQAAPALELVGQPAFVHRGEPYTVDVDVTGAPTGATLDMVVHELLQSRQQFRTTLEGELGDVEHRVEQQPVTGAAGAASIGFTVGGSGTDLPSRGVYPVEVRLRDAGGEPIATTVTYLSYLPDDTPEFLPLDVAVLVDIAGPPALQPSGAYEPEAGTVDRVRERVQLAHDTAGVPLTLAPRPETVEALANRSIPEAALVEQLAEAAAGMPVLARPFVDVDLGALQRSDLLSEANQQADGGANVVRSRLAVEPTPGIWLSGPTFGAESSQVAVDLGINRAIVPPTAVDRGEGDDDEFDPPPTAPVQLGDGGPLTMVTDTALADHLTNGDGMVDAHRFIAELTSAWIEAPADHRGVVVHLPADAEIDPAVLAVALRALGDGQAVRAVPVEQIFDVPAPENGPATVSPTPVTSGPDLDGIAPTVRAVRSSISGVGALLDDPATAQSLEHSVLLSTGTDTPDDQRAAYVQRAEAALDSVQGAVTLPDAFRITLTSRSSSIPVTLTNNTDRPLSVRVELDSDQLEFPDGDVLTPVLAPGTTRIEVPVRTRTSGAFTLDVTVTSTNRAIVLDTSTFDVRSTAISGVGLVLSVGACLFLAIWWARHWRNTRRSRQLMPADAVTPAAGTPVLDESAALGAAMDAEPSPPATRNAGGPYRPAHMARPRSRSG